MSAFATLLAQPGVEEVSELRGRVGFMAYHGGALEAMTDVIARRAAERASASCYSVIQPPGMREHLSSIKVNPNESEALAGFVEHVDIVITVPVSYTHLTLPTMIIRCRSRWSPYH